MPSWLRSFLERFVKTINIKFLNCNIFFEQINILMNLRSVQKPDISVHLQIAEINQTIVGRDIRVLNRVGRRFINLRRFFCFGIESENCILFLENKMTTVFQPNRVRTGIEHFLVSRGFKVKNTDAVFSVFTIEKREQQFVSVGRPVTHRIRALKIR